MTLDAALRPVALGLLNDFGKSITYRRVTDGTYDPNTGAITGQTTTDKAIKGSIKQLGSERFTNALIEVGDMLITIADMNLGLVPDTQTDKIIMDSETWSIVNVDSVFSGEQVAIYNILVRR